MDDVKQKVWTSIFLFLLMMALFLFYKEPGFFQHDMVEYAMYAEYVILDDYDVLYSPYFAAIDAGAFPWRTGTIYLTVLFFWLFNLFGIGSEFTTFFAQFFFGSLSIVVLYLFLIELYGKQIPALLGSLFFGINAPLFNSILSKDHGTEYFFAFAAVYLLVLGVKQQKNWLLFLSGSCLGLLLWMREGTLFFPVIYAGIFFFYDKRWKNIFWILIPFLLFAAAAFYMYLWLMITVATTVSNASLFTYTTLIVSEILAWYPLFFFLFMLLGITYGFYRKEKIIIFFISMILLFLVLFTKNATFDIRHLGIYVFFPASVIICYGLCCLQNKRIRVIAYFFGVLLCVQVFSAGIPLFEQRKEHIYTEEFGEGIATVVPSDGIVFLQKDFCLFIAYYAKKNCQGIPTSTEQFDATLASGKRIFVFYEAGFGFYDNATKSIIEEHYALTTVYAGKFETFHHADLKPQIYDEMLIEVKMKS